MRPRGRSTVIASLGTCTVRAPCGRVYHCRLEAKHPQRAGRLRRKLRRSWKGRVSAHPTSALSPSRHLIIATVGSLEAYSRKPDCFRRVSSSISARCGDLETNEVERVKGKRTSYMLSADLADTAHIPSGACHDVVRDSYRRTSLTTTGMHAVSTGHGLRLHPGRVSREMCLVRRIVVEVVRRDLTKPRRALSRSAQYWSSYSGYLREVCELWIHRHRIG